MSMNYHKKEMLRQKDPITVKQVTSDNFIPTGATCGYVFALLSLVIATDVTRDSMMSSPVQMLALDCYRILGGNHPRQSNPKPTRWRMNSYPYGGLPSQLHKSEQKCSTNGFLLKRALGLQFRCWVMMAFCREIMDLLQLLNPPEMVLLLEMADFMKSFGWNIRCQ